MNKVLTIVVTYNGMKWLDKCLSSLKKSTVANDIFIVDNGSTDGSIEYIRNNFPEAIFIESKENLGFGRANNLGLKYAVENGYDYVYLLNQDAWIEEDTLYKMISASAKNTEYGILSPLQVYKGKAKLDNNFAGCIPLDLISDILCAQPVKELYEVNYVMAAHWLIKIDALKTVGGFSPAFRHYAEDDNLINRMHFKGYKVGVVPSTRCTHDRENRPYTKEEAKYRDYVRTIAMINNPFITNPFLRLVKRHIRQLFRPSSIKWKYFFSLYRDYFKGKKYRKEYNKTGPYLN